MLFYFLFLLLGAAAAVGITVAAQLSWWWLLPLAIGLAAAIAAAYMLTLLFITLFLPRKEGGRHSPTCRFIVVHTVAWVLFFLGYRLDAEGLEKLPTDRTFLLVGNHRSNLDPMVEMVALRRWKLAFVSKPENFKIPVAGPFIRSCSYLSIDRDDPRKAVSTIHRAADYIREGRCSMGIYPEGTRSHTGELLPFHHGSFKIAKLADCPIAVMTVRYGKRHGLRRRVELRVPEVLDVEYVRANRTNAISDRVRETVERQLEQPLD